MTQKKLYIIDGSGFIFRAFHALPPLTRPDKTPVGAVYGFCNMLAKLYAEMHADHMVVVFDAARKNYRYALYPNYKANRGETPEDLIPQFPLIREACQAFGVPQLEKNGYEADDIIATLVKQARLAQREVVVVSSDKDLMQLMGPGVSMYDQMKNKYYSLEDVHKKFGVTPDKVVDIQALAGDSSDNIPGVAGIGPKTAAQLIEKFGSFEGLFENLHEISQPKRRASLEAEEGNARISRALVRLCADVPLDIALDAFEVPALDADKLQAFLATQGFKTLLNRLNLSSVVALPKEEGVQEETALPTPIPQTYVSLQTIDALESYIKGVYKEGLLAIDIETTSLDTQTTELVGIALARSPGDGAYIPLRHTVDMLAPAPQLTLDIVLETLGPVLSDKSIRKVGHNLKFDLAVLQRLGFTVHNYDDTLLMASLLYPGRHGLDEMVKRVFDHEMIPFKSLVPHASKGQTFADVSIQAATDYAAEDADFTLRLWQTLSPELMTQKSTTAYWDFDRPLVPILVDMEKNGILVLPQKLADLSATFESKLSTLAEEIHRLAGDAFNIASPKQLGEVLFDKLQYPGGKKGKTGAYGTGAGVLEKLAHDGYEVASLVLKWRQFAKLKSTYTDALRDKINPTTHRIHTSFGLATTTTGRLSSSDPNLQNIPIRTVEGREIRQAFVAEAGKTLLSLDYSQIELRLLAHYAQIESLQKAFLDGVDIHALTASQVMGLPVEEITPLLRRKAKAINFGIIYGISAFGLGQQLEISTHDAKTYIDAYFKQYPGIQAYMDAQIQFAKQQGYVTTLAGRRCYMPEINSKNSNLRGFAERQAINAPLQGSAADIIKKAMQSVHAYLGEDPTTRGKMLLQVHDELILEVPTAQIDEVGQACKALMENAMTIAVPLIVDVGQGQNWDEAH